MGSSFSTTSVTSNQVTVTPTESNNTIESNNVVLEDTNEVREDTNEVREDTNEVLEDTNEEIETSVPSSPPVQLPTIQKQRYIHPIILLINNNNEDSVITTLNNYLGNKLISEIDGKIVYDTVDQYEFFGPVLEFLRNR